MDPSSVKRTDMEYRGVVYTEEWNVCRQNDSTHKVFIPVGTHRISGNLLLNLQLHISDFVGNLNNHMLPHVKIASHTHTLIGGLVSLLYQATFYCQILRGVKNSPLPIS